jgi:hypothetical protein
MGNKMVAIATCVIAGFFSALGWWGAQRMVIDHIEKPETEQKAEK